MKARRVYKNPPIQEALVEFQFAGDQNWDVTVFGELYAQMKEDYPAKALRHAVEQGIRVTPAGVQALPPKTGIDRVQFMSTDGLDRVAVGVNVLSVHRLRPYPGWEVFSGRIGSSLARYSAVAGTPGVTRIGVRYVNQLACPDGLDTFRKLIHAPVQVPPALPTDLGQFLCRYEARHDPSTLILLTIALHPAEEGEREAIVDLDVVFAPASDTPLPFGQALVEASRLHDLEGELFRNLITDQAEVLFDAQN